MALIKCLDQRRKQGKGKGIVHANNQLIFPALMQLHGLLFQLPDRMQNFAAFFQQHLSGAGEPCPVAGPVEDLNIEIAFELVNRVAEGGGRLEELCRRGSKAPLFFERIKDNQDIQQRFHAHPLVVRLCSASGITPSA
ncbi:hypothetical protein D3C79_857610 [compost metagenome]